MADEGKITQSTIEVLREETGNEGVKITQSTIEVLREDIDNFNAIQVAHQVVHSISRPTSVYTANKGQLVHQMVQVLSKVYVPSSGVQTIIIT